MLTVLAACGVLVRAPSPAAAAPFACQTTSFRTPAQTVVSLDDASLHHLPRQAVRIVPGETLCITGRVHERRMLVDLRLVERVGPRDTPALELRMTRGAAETRLIARHSFEHDVTFEAATVFERSDLAFEQAASLFARPGIHAVEAWEPGIREALLYGFELHPAPTPRPKLFPSIERRLGSITVSLSVGEQEARMPALSRALVRDGFVPPPAVRTMRGIELGFDVKRVKFGLSLAGEWSRRPKASNGADMRLLLSAAGFSIGYELLRLRGLTLFTSSGLTVQRFGLDARAPGLSLFLDRLTACDKSGLVSSQFLIPIELGADEWLPLGPKSPASYAGSEPTLAFQFGARAGWQQQVAGGWELNEGDARDIEGGPKVDMSGLLFRLVLGVAFYSTDGRAKR